MKKIHLYILILILTIGGIIRLLNLDFLTLWVDEYVHVLTAKNVVDGTGDLVTDDNNGILLTVFIIPFFSIFETSAFWSRFPSVLFGIGSIYMTYKLSKSLFNKNVGIFSSVIMAFSLYNTFWSRIARNYAIYGFFILLTLYFLHKLYNHTYSNRKEVLKPIIFFIGSFIASFLSHQLAFFLSFGYAFYIILSFINTKYINKTQVTKWNKYSIPFIPAILLFTVITLPFFGNLVRPIISYFLPQNIVNWVIPDWDHLSKLWASKPYFSWDLYVNVLKNDLSLLYYFGIVGFILTLIKKENRASGIFIISFFVPILLLMSFIFREPVLPRYLIGIYPLFVIAIAFCFDFILQFITQITKKSELSTWLLIPFTVVLALMSPLQRSIDLINSKQHGQVVPKALSHWHFTNWKEPATKIRKNIKDNDVVMTTNINATKFYLDISENLHWFRQMKYDGSLRRYVHRKDPNASKGSGYSLEGVKNLVNNNNRGWLLADYYFDNVMTDPKVRQYIIQNLDYHYEYGNESIKVFSWDKSRPKKYNNSILEELGRNPNKFQSKLYNLNVTDPKQVSHLIIEAEGLDYSNELSVIINKKKSFLVNPNTGSIYRSTKDHLSRQFFQVKIDNTLLKPGSNSVIFQYNKKLKKEKMKGCVVFNTQLR